MNNAWPVEVNKLPEVPSSPAIALPVTAEDLAAYPSPVSSHSPIHGGAKKKKKMKKASRKSKLTQY